MPPRELPVLDESRCTGCGACVPVCPPACLDTAGGLPWLPRPLACVSCGVCAVVCPVEAIELRPAG